MSDTIYCPSCGTHVSPFIMFAGGDEVKRCPDCGLELMDVAEPRFAKLDKVIIAEDSAVLRDKIGEILEEKGIAEWVTKCADGSEFLQAFAQCEAQKKPVNLAIVDVNMPIINGVNATIAMRAIEKGYEVKRLVPILFFTSKKCDDTFKKVLNYTKPAKYINKGTGNSPEEFADRLYKVLHHLLTAK